MAMKFSSTSVLLITLLAWTPAQAKSHGGSNPLGAVLSLIDELSAKIVKEGEAEQKAYDEYVEWCDDASKNAAFDIKTLTSKKEGLEALIAKMSANIGAATDTIAKLGASISEAESELKDATTIREKEKSEFLVAEGELVDGIDALDRAIAILEREMAKNPAFLQKIDTSNAQKMVKSLALVLDAAAFSLPDQKKLLAFVQSRDKAAQGDESKAEEDEAALGGAVGAPAAAVYQSHSSSIVDVLEDMKEKAEGELSDLRKAETASQHNFDMLKQSLTDQVAADTKEKSDEEAFKLESEQTKATAEGDLTATGKDLANAEKVLATAQSTCMTVAADHEKSVASRAAELKAIAEAKSILTSTTSGAEEKTYSFLQTGEFSSLSTRADLANAEVVNLIKKLAKQHHSAALSQLASKITAVLRFGSSSGEDPFVKVKGLIQELIDRLIAEGEAEAKEHAFCTAEMAKTEAKKEELEEDIAKLKAKIDRASSLSAKLKAEVKELQAGLAELAKAQTQMDAIRREQNRDYVEAKSDLTLGLDGVRRALGVLRDYYGASFVQQPAYPEKHEAAAGAGGSIIGILEVVESDFAKNLAATESAEADQEEDYEKVTQENKITKTMKTQDVKYKTAEFTSLDKTIANLSSDKESADSELGAVLEYYAKLKDRCIAKPETYEDRKRRRESEIEGLKEALGILENETVEMKVSLVQRKRRGLRGY